MAFNGHKISVDIVIYCFYIARKSKMFEETEMVMKRNEEIAIKAGRAVEKLALDLLDRKSAESILVEFNTPTHAFKVSPISLSEKRVPEQVKEASYRAKNWPQLCRAGKMSLREAAQHRATNYALWQVDNPIPDDFSAQLERKRSKFEQDIIDALVAAPSPFETKALGVEYVPGWKPHPMGAAIGHYKRPCPWPFDFAEIEKRVLAGISTACIDGSEISAAAWLAMAPDELVNPTRATVVPPIDDEKLRQAIEILDGPKCSEKPIYYFASNDYKAVQAWAEKHGLSDWNRARAGFDYPPNAVVVVSYFTACLMIDTDGFEDVLEMARDASRQGVPKISLRKLSKKLYSVDYPEMTEALLHGISARHGGSK